MKDRSRFFRTVLKGSASRAGAKTGADGVTLFELIVVVVVTAVLAVLLVLSTNFLVVRTKVSRVKEEQRVLVRALQNYQMDYANLPRESSGLEALVAPTAYLASLPRDPFRSSEPDTAYFYFSPDGAGRSYAVVSAGPDGKLDAMMYLNQARPARGQGGKTTNAAPAGAGGSGGDDGSNVPAGVHWFDDYLARYTYDPTNGTVSSGDIISVVVNY